MSGRLEGKVAVITGGASGMGRATVMRFLDEGARVVVADMNEATGAELSSSPGRGMRRIGRASFGPTCPARRTSRR